MSPCSAVVAAIPLLGPQAQNDADMYSQELGARIAHMEQQVRAVQQDIRKLVASSQAMEARLVKLESAVVQPHTERAAQSEQLHKHKSSWFGQVTSDITCMDVALWVLIAMFISLPY
jgi:hypothetical protein